MDHSYLKSLAVSADGFVFDPRTGHSYTTNATGMAILTKLQQGCDLDEVVAALKAELSAPDSVAEDVRQFVDALRELGLATRQPEGTSA